MKKFRHLFLYESAYLFGRPSTWAFAVAVVGFVFMFVRTNFVGDALYEDYPLNAPFLIASATVFGGLIWLMTAAAIAGSAGARDVTTGIYPLLYTLPLRKAEYLGARFAAAFTVNATLLLLVQGGILLAIYLPGIESALIGDFRPAAYLTAFALISLPNAFVATALQFWLASVTGRTMAAYFGSFLLFFTGFFIASFLLYKNGLGTLLDPVGIRFIVEDLAHTWTTVEQKSRLLSLEGTLLANRLLWTGVAVVSLGVMYRRFRFSHRVPPDFTLGFFKRKRSHGSGHLGSDSIKHIPPSKHFELRRGFGLRSQAIQTLAIALNSLRGITFSGAGFFLLVILPLLTIPVLIDQMESNGARLLPSTTRIILELTAPLSDEMIRWVVIPALIIYFAGELTWRERDAGMDEVTGAMPWSEWAFVLGKILAIGLLLFLFTAMQMFSGVAAQTLLDYNAYEVGLYVKILFGLQLPEYILFAVLTVAIHVVVHQKYLAHLAAVLAYAFIALSSMFGVEHDLLIYSASPRWTYSEMRGFGSSIVPWAWFKGYWATWAALLAIAAKVFLVRDREKGFRARMQQIHFRFDKLTMTISLMVVACIVAVGGFIFYNTNILNDYVPMSERKQRAATYEQRYSALSRDSQPGARYCFLNIEIYPDRGEATIEGSYQLFNDGQEPIDSVHIALAPATDTEINFTALATAVIVDDAHGHRTYALKRPLLPGDSLQMRFKVGIGSTGFRESGVNGHIVANGTFFTSGDYLPVLGYRHDRELRAASERRRYGLSSRPVIATLDDMDASHAKQSGMSLETVMGTSADQVAVAPGALRRSWIRNTSGDNERKTERRYFHYVSDRSLGSEWAFASARYAVHETEWRPQDTLRSDEPVRPIVIKLYHHPGHNAHVDGVVQSIKASLSYYTSAFGPYRYGQLTVVERPGNGTGMHADASMITHAEGFTQWKPVTDSTSHDHPFAIVTHETAHQWTIPYAFVEGAPVMSESLAWYYGMKAVENARGTEALYGLFKFMWQLHPYSPIHRGEPLLRGLDPYMSYRKGPFALYALSEYVGDQQVNMALRRLLDNHRRPNAPLATTVDLYRELKKAAPDSLHYLLHDLFEVNTYWKFEIDKALTTRNSDGSWLVSLEVQAEKFVVDSAGVKHEAPLNEWIDVGVFAKLDGKESPIYLKKHKIVSGAQSVQFVVPREPSRAGVDPFHVLDWEQRTDRNLRSVTRIANKK
jgi:ABC-2 type transport system permease protein